MSKEALSTIVVRRRDYSSSKLSYGSWVGDSLS